MSIEDDILASKPTDAPIVEAPANELHTKITNFTRKAIIKIADSVMHPKTPPSPINNQLLKDVVETVKVGGPGALVAAPLLTAGEVTLAAGAAAAVTAGLIAESANIGSRYLTRKHEAEVDGTPMQDARLNGKSSSVVYNALKDACDGSDGFVGSRMNALVANPHVRGALEDNQALNEQLVEKTKKLGRALFRLPTTDTEPSKDKTSVATTPGR